MKDTSRDFSTSIQAELKLSSTRYSRVTFSDSTQQTIEVFSVIIIFNYVSIKKRVY